MLARMANRWVGLGLLWLMWVVVFVVVGGDPIRLVPLLALVALVGATLVEILDGD